METFARLNGEFPALFTAFAAVFGAVVGSFLNVVILRLPKGESLWRPGSHCACGAPIRWFHNIPVLGWLWLRGRARCCGGKISARYPLVEALTALLFAALWAKFPPAAAACWMLFAAALVGASFIDVDTLTIPGVFTTGLAMAGLALSVAVPSLHGFSGDNGVVNAARSLAFSLTGLMAGSGLVLWVAVVAETVLRKEAMGFADVTLAGAIGAFCGWQGAVFALFGGAVAGVVWIGLACAVSGIFRVRRSAVLPAENEGGERVEPGFGARVPFGPMLAAGALLHVLVASEAVAAHFARAAALLGL